MSNSNDILKDLPGIKAKDIGRTITGQGVGSQGPIFYRVTVEQCGLDRDAISRQHGLELLVGNAGIAAALGPDEPIARVLYKSVVFVGMADFMMLPLCACLTADEAAP